MAIVAVARGQNATSTDVVLAVVVLDNSTLAVAAHDGGTGESTRHAFLPAVHLTPRACMAVCLQPHACMAVCLQPRPTQLHATWKNRRVEPRPTLNTHARPPTRHIHRCRDTAHTQWDERRPERHRDAVHGRDQRPRAPTNHRGGWRATLCAWVLAEHLPKGCDANHPAANRVAAGFFGNILELILI